MEIPLFKPYYIKPEFLEVGLTQGKLNEIQTMVNRILSVPTEYSETVQLEFDDIEEIVVMIHRNNLKPRISRMNTDSYPCKTILYQQL